MTKVVLYMAHAHSEREKIQALHWEHTSAFAFLVVCNGFLLKISNVRSSNLYHFPKMKSNPAQFSLRSTQFWAVHNFQNSYTKISKIIYSCLKLTLWGKNRGQHLLLNWVYFIYWQSLWPLGQLVQKKWEGEDKRLRKLCTDLLIKNKHGSWTSGKME